MPTPRSESIKKSLLGEASIREPKMSHDPENKIDHYAVLAQVINRGVLSYLDNQDLLEPLAQTSSRYHLGEALNEGVNRSIFATLNSEPFMPHYENLEQSQYLRHFNNSSRWDEIRLGISAGTRTFTETFGYMFSILSRLGTEIATHPENWHIADKLAKLNLDQLSAYYATYLSDFKNWSSTMDHFEITSSNAVQFKAGYPNAAHIPGIEMSIKEIELLDPTIGCPVTFAPENIQRLWTLYAFHAQRISEPIAANSGDTEAYAR